MLTLPVTLQLYSGEVLITDDVEARLMLDDTDALLDVHVLHSSWTFVDNQRCIVTRYVPIGARTDAVALALKVSARAALTTDEVRSRIAAARASGGTHLALVSSGGGGRL